MKYLTRTRNLVLTALLAGGLGLGSAASFDVMAQDAPSEMTDPNDIIAGTYAGTFICSFGEMGMSLSINTVAPAPFNALPGSCKSGAGPCNEARASRLASLRAIDGVLNFFPTAGNPGAPSGAFRVSGLAETAAAPDYQIELSAGEWIVQPLGFGSSAMTANLANGVMTGTPTAAGCTSLKMQKIIED